MAFESGTATNFRDLIAKIATFAVSTTWWEVLNQTSDNLYMKGEGTAGLDEIYVGIKAYEDTANNRYNLELFGSWGYREGRAYNRMPRTNFGAVVCYLWNSAIPYWLSVTSRRILCFMKVGSVYQCLHLGLFEQNGTEMQYPYPLLVAGCGNSLTRNYSDTTNENSAFWNGVDYPTNGVGNLIFPGGTWGAITASGGGAAKPTAIVDFLISALRNTLITDPGDSYLVLPLYIVETARTSILGKLDGLFYISGYSNSAENTFTIDSDEYIIFPNVFRTTYGAFCAMRKN